MLNISETKLAGLTLMLGPSLASLLYIIFVAIPPILSSTSIDQMDWSVIAREQSELDIWIRLPLLLVPVFLTFSVFGFSVLSCPVRSLNSPSMIGPFTLRSISLLKGS